MLWCCIGDSNDSGGDDSGVDGGGGSGGAGCGVSGDDVRNSLAFQPSRSQIRQRDYYGCLVDDEKPTYSSFMKELKYKHSLQISTFG